MITVTYDDGGVQRALTLAADSLSDLTPIFGLYLTWLRPDVAKVFAENNFAPLDEETLKNRNAHLAAKSAKFRASAVSGLSRKLEKERSRATKRYVKAAMKGKDLTRPGRTIERHDRVRAAFEALKQGRLTELPAGAKRLPERMIRAGMRASNKIAALESGAPLGEIASSMKGEIHGKEGYMEYFSAWKKAGIHNEGGTAGHNAHIPKREFLAWNPERIAKLAELAAAYVAEKLKK